MRRLDHGQRTRGTAPCRSLPGWLPSLRGAHKWMQVDESSVGKTAAMAEASKAATPGSPTSSPRKRESMVPTSSDKLSVNNHVAATFSRTWIFRSPFLCLSWWWHLRHCASRPEPSLGGERSASCRPASSPDGFPPAPARRLGRGLLPALLCLPVHLRAGDRSRCAGCAAAQ